MFILTYADIYLYIYSGIYNKMFYIYTIAETTEPASKIFWMSLQVEPKPIYMYRYIYICIFIHICIYTHIHMCVYIYIPQYICIYISVYLCINIYEYI